MIRKLPWKSVYTTVFGSFNLQVKLLFYGFGFFIATQSPEIDSTSFLRRFSAKFPGASGFTPIGIITQVILRQNFKVLIVKWLKNLLQFSQNAW